MEMHADVSMRKVLVRADTSLRVQPCDESCGVFSHFPRSDPEMCQHKDRNRPESECPLHVRPRIARLLLLVHAREVNLS